MAPYGNGTHRYEANASRVPSSLRAESSARRDAASLACCPAKAPPPPRPLSSEDTPLLRSMCYGKGEGPELSLNTPGPVLNTYWLTRCKA